MNTNLRLQISLQNQKSVVTDSYFTSPLKIGLPNHQGNRLKVVLMMASAGILKGDTFQYHIRCRQGTKVLLTEQSYTKIFNTGDGGAARCQNIIVEPEASMYYWPCAVIPFAQSTYDGNTMVHLSRSSEFVYRDILAAGRIGMGEKFAFTHYANNICVKVDDVMVFVDKCLFEPEKMNPSGMFFFDEFTHQGTLYYYGRTEKQELLLKWFFERMEELNKRNACGITKAREGICFRILAHTAQDIEEIFDEMIELFQDR